MAKQSFTPYVPASKTMPELTFKALFLGVLMAVALGAANAYLGMKVGMTVAATFPAAVVAMAALRPFKGNILEENIARTTASVGEALVAGAIFTIPALILSGAWDKFHYFESTAVMVIGGLLGVLFVVMLRHTLVVEADLPFPESVAATEIVKAGQAGQTGAGLVFGAMGIAALWELIKNTNGAQIIKEKAAGFYAMGKSSIAVLGREQEYSGGLYLETPAASPAVIGVGFIVGPKISAVLFSGAVTGWLLLVPLAMFLNPTLISGLETSEELIALAQDVWFNQIRPLAVGTMIVAAFYTLFQLRGSLMGGLKKAVEHFDISSPAATSERTEIDLDLKKVLIAIGVMAVPMWLLYHYLSSSIGASLLLTVLMLILGFLFAAVSGYLVGLIGSSNNPMSGLTLSALLIASLLMVLIGVTDAHGVAAVLGVAGVVCCIAGISGDMMQDLKVGHLLGGTPWKMQVGELIGVVAAAAAMPVFLLVLDNVYKIGSTDLPAPQAGLMALMANGIVGGEMAWSLVIVGMFFGFALILIGAPAPMLIAVGMYLPFDTTAAVFVGGIIRYILDQRLKKQEITEKQRTTAESSGVLVSSGLIAGQALMAVILAFVVLYGKTVMGLKDGEYLLPHFAESFWAGLLVYPMLLGLLVWLPLRRMRRLSRE
jgi:putative OPT family oligopeptide transporter